MFNLEYLLWLIAIGGGIVFAILLTVPFVLPRVISRIIFALIYKGRVVNAHHLPSKGGALLVCNHVSYLDQFFVFGALSRPVRFFTDQRIYDLPFFHSVCVLSKSIPIDRDKGPKEILRAFAEVRGALAKGDLVCVFPEGVLTPTGGLLEFHKGFEVIMKKMNVPVIPLFIDLPVSAGNYLGRFPRIRYPLSVTVGQPLVSNISAEHARDVIQKIGVEANASRHRWRKALPLVILDRVKCHPFKLCMVDALGKPMNYHCFFSSALVWSRQISSSRNDDVVRSPEMVGILLPTSCSAAVSHLAIALVGKIPVHFSEPRVKDDIDLWMRRYSLRRVVTSRAYLKKCGIVPIPGMIFWEDFQSVRSGIRAFGYDALVLLAPRWFLIRFFIKGGKAPMDEVATVVLSEGDCLSSPGVMLTHGNIAAQIESLTKTFTVQTKDVVVGLVPFSRAFGLVTTLFFPLGNGLGVVYGLEKSSAKCLGSGLKLFQGSMIFMTASLLPEFTSAVSPEQAVQVRKVVVEEGSVPESSARVFREKFGIFPLMVYGTNELSGLLTVGLPDYVNLVEMEQQLGHLAGRIGYPLQGCMVKVVHPRTFAPVAPNEDGLLLVKGSGVMKGYYRNSGRTIGVFYQGWYITGDMARIDVTGCFTITGRSSFALQGKDGAGDYKIQS